MGRVSNVYSLARRHIAVGPVLLSPRNGFRWVLLAWRLYFSELRNCLTKSLSTSYVVLRLCLTRTYPLTMTSGC